MKKVLAPFNIVKKSSDERYTKVYTIKNRTDLINTLKNPFSVALYKEGDFKDENFLAANAIFMRLDKDNKTKLIEPYTVGQLTNGLEMYDSIFVSVPKTANGKPGFRLYVIFPLGKVITNQEDYKFLGGELRALFYDLQPSGAKLDNVYKANGIDEDFQQADISINCGPSILSRFKRLEDQDALHEMVHGVGSGLIKDAAKGEYVQETQGIDTIVTDLNRNHAVVQSQGKTLFISESIDPTDGKLRTDFSSRRDLIDWNANRFVDSRKVINEWVKHHDRREYERIDFMPGMNHGPNVLNLWKGFAHQNQPGDKDCSLYIQHIENNIAGGDPEKTQYILNWMATLVQKPFLRPEVAIALRGGQGTGKSLFATTLGGLFPMHFIHATNPDHLTGKYNAHMKECLLIFSDEAIKPTSKVAKSALKTLITENTRLIEYKGKDVIPVSNYTWVILASNEENIVPAEIGDRRFFITDVGDGNKRDREFFGQLVSDMENGGYGALYRYLDNRDISNIDLTKFPRTAAKMEIVLANMSPIHRWWHNKLSRGVLFDGNAQWLERVKTSRLFDDFRRETRSTDLDSIFGKKMFEIVPGIEKKNLIDDNGTNSNFYILPSLEDCRKGFEAYVKCEIDWME